MMTCRQGEHQLEGWLARVEASDLPELRSFANGIRRDQQAVTAGAHPAAGRAALVITSPPYGSSVHGQVTAEQRRGTSGGVRKYDNHYGDDPGNLASRAWTSSSTGSPRSWPAAGPCCAPAAWPSSPRGPGASGELVDLPAAVLPAAARAGLIPAARGVALLAGLRDGQLIARPSFFQLHNLREARGRGEPWHLIVHEDVIIVRNPRFPGSSPELKGARREHEGAAQRFSRDYPRVEGELGAAA